MAEAAVKVAKNMMRKCAQNKEDPYLGLLNTPIEIHKRSPAQLLFGRRTLIPTDENRLRSGSDNSSVAQQQENQNISRAEHLNKHRRDLKPLQQGDRVRIQPIDAKHGRSTWKPGIVLHRSSNRDYHVQTESGRSLRRNRQFLRRSVAMMPVDHGYNTQATMATEHPSHDTMPQQPVASPPHTHSNLATPQPVIPSTPTTPNQPR